MTTTTDAVEAAFRALHLTSTYTYDEFYRLVQTGQSPLEFLGEYVAELEGLRAALEDAMIAGPYRMPSGDWRKDLGDLIDWHTKLNTYMENTITRAEPAPVGFDAAIKQLGEPDVATGHWSLDEGNLRWFVGQCKAEPKPITDEVLWEAVEYFHKRMSGLKKGDTVFLNLESLNIRLLVIEAAIDELSKRRAEPSPKVEIPDGEWRLKEEQEPCK